MGGPHIYGVTGFNFSPAYVKPMELWMTDSLTARYKVILFDI